MLQYRLMFIDNLPRRMIENKKEADRMVAEDTLMYKEGFGAGHAKGHAKGHADGERDKAIDMVKELYKEHVDIDIIARSSKLPLEEVRKILSEE